MDAGVVSGCWWRVGAHSPVPPSPVNKKVAYLKASNTGAGCGSVTLGLGCSFGSSVALCGDYVAVGAGEEASGATGVNSGGDLDVSQPFAGAVYVYRRNAGGLWELAWYVKASNTVSSSFFGNAVAWGSQCDTLAVGAHGEPHLGRGIDASQSGPTSNDVGAVYLFRRVGSSLVQTHYIKAPNSEAGDLFGASLHWSDSGVLAVGAPFESSGARGVNGDAQDNSMRATGAVHLYRFVGSVLQYQAYVKPPNPQEFLVSGYSVAQDADGLLAVSASNDRSRVPGDPFDSSGAGVGAVNIYSTRPTLLCPSPALNITQQLLPYGLTYVKQSLAGAGAKFATSLAMSSDGLVLAVGAPHEASDSVGVNGRQDNANAADSGAVYVYRQSVRRQWTQVAYVKSSASASEHMFGSSVALSRSGTRMLVGAPGRDPGAAAIFTIALDANGTTTVTEGTRPLLCAHLHVHASRVDARRSASSPNWLQIWHQCGLIGRWHRRAHRRSLRPIQWRRQRLCVCVCTAQRIVGCGGAPRSHGGTCWALSRLLSGHQRRRRCGRVGCTVGRSSVFSESARRSPRVRAPRRRALGANG